MEAGDISATREQQIPFLHRVRLRNYKSIAGCDTRLGAFTILVGRNAAGKSNFLDALRFVSDSLQNSLDHALKERTGIDAVRRISTGHPRNFLIELEFWLHVTETMARYSFEVAARRNGAFIVKREQLDVFSPSESRPAPNSPIQQRLNLDVSDVSVASYLVEEGDVRKASIPNMPPAASDRLYLTNAAGLPAFRPAYDALTSMGFYNLNPESIRDLQSPDAGELLRRDGGNLASVIGRLSREEPATLKRVQGYLASIVPGIVGFERKSLGPRETLEFRQKVHGARAPWKFFAATMSDGTLRALGVLVAIAQIARERHPATFVGIEEPETALHPAAAGSLMDALRSGSRRTQIAVTSHSPDLLDYAQLEQDTLLVVQSEEGTSRIAGIDAASREAIKQHLYSAGDLLRMDQLEPDAEQVREQLELFDRETA
jgi:predicted ATPase